MTAKETTTGVMVTLLEACRARRSLDFLRAVAMIGAKKGGPMRILAQVAHCLEFFTKNTSTTLNLMLAEIEASLSAWVLHALCALPNCYSSSSTRGQTPLSVETQGRSIYMTQ